MPSNDPHAGCPHCVAGGYTYSEAFRHLCEARHLAKLPGQAFRKSYLEGVEKKRGSAAAERLRRDAKAIYEGVQLDDFQPTKEE